jgi:hypothetical protein
MVIAGVEIQSAEVLGDMSVDFMPGVRADLAEALLSSKRLLPGISESTEEVQTQHRCGGPSETSLQLVVTW